MLSLQILGRKEDPDEFLSLDRAESSLNRTQSSHAQEGRSSGTTNSLTGMPFAPATLQEYADECYEGLDGARDSARYMTITFNCTEKMRLQSPGVVHVDGTARPQVLDTDTAPDFYKIAVAYHKLTGIPTLINTSFNMHGEPIVCTPEDALRSFNEGKLDYLAIGNWLVVNPELKKHGK